MSTLGNKVKVALEAARAALAVAEEIEYEHASICLQKAVEALNDARDEVAYCDEIEEMNRD